MWSCRRSGSTACACSSALKRLAELPPDTPCYCEHMREERDYALNFARVHYLAQKSGVRFLRRAEQSDCSELAC